MNNQTKAMREIIETLRRRQQEQQQNMAGGTTPPVSSYDPTKQVEGYKKRIEGSGMDAEKETDKRKPLEKLFNLPEDQNPLFDLFEVIGRPQQAVFGGIEAKQQGKSFGEGFSEGLSGKKYTQFKQILNNASITTDSGSDFGMDDVLGFVGDVFADPVDLALIAAAPFTGGTTGAIVFADKVADGARAANAAVKTTQGLLDAAKVANNAQDIAKYTTKLGKQTKQLATLTERSNLAQTLKTSAEALKAAEITKDTVKIAEAAKVYKEALSPLKVRKSVLEMGFRGAKVGLTGAAKVSDNLITKTLNAVKEVDVKLHGNLAKNLDLAKGYQDAKQMVKSTFAAAKDLPRELIKKSTKARGQAELAENVLKAKMNKFGRYIDDENNFKILQEQINTFNVSKTAEVTKEITDIKKQIQRVTKLINNATDDVAKKALMDTSNGYLEKLNKAKARAARYTDMPIKTKEDLYNKLYLVYEYGYDSLAKNIDIKGVYKDRSLKNLIFDDFIMNNPLLEREALEVESLLKELLPDLFENAKGPSLFVTVDSKALKGKKLYFPEKDLWETVRKRIVNLNKDEDVVKEITELSEEVVDIITKNNSEIKRIQKETSQLQKTILNNKEDLKKLVKKQNGLKTDIKRTQTNLDKLTEGQKGFEKSVKEIESLKTKLADNTKEIETIETSLEAFKKKQKELLGNKTASVKKVEYTNKIESNEKILKNLEEKRKQAPKIVTKEEYTALKKQMNSAVTWRDDAIRLRKDAFAKGKKEEATKWIESQMREEKRIREIQKGLDNYELYKGKGAVAADLSKENDLKSIIAQDKKLLEQVNTITDESKKAAIDAQKLKKLKKTITDDEALLKSLESGVPKVDESAVKLRRSRLQKLEKAKKEADDLVNAKQKLIDDTTKTVNDNTKSLDDLTETNLKLTENERVVTRPSITYEEFTRKLEQRINREGLYTAEDIDNIRDLSGVPKFNEMLDNVHNTMDEMATTLNDIMGTQFKFDDSFLPHMLNPERDKFGVSFAKEASPFTTANFKGNSYVFSNRKWQMAATESNNVLMDVTENAFQQGIIKEDYYKKLMTEENVKLFETDVRTSMADFVKSGPQAAKNSFILNESVKISLLSDNLMRARLQGESAPPNMRAVNKSDLVNKLDQLSRYAQDKDAVKEIIEAVDQKFPGSAQIFIDRSVDELIGRVSNRTEVSKFFKVMEALTDSFKIGKLLSPGFQMRNFIGNLSNMYLAGVPIGDITRYYKRSNRILSKIGHGGADDLFQIKYQGIRKLTLDEENLLTLYESFIRDGFAEVGNALHDIPPWLLDINKSGGLEVDRTKKLLNQARKQGNTAEIAKLEQRLIDVTKTRTDKYTVTRWGKEVVSFNGRMNFAQDQRFRMALLMYAQENPEILVRANAESAQEFVRRVLFDYTDLSYVERNKIKKIVPFYTFTKKNLAFQAQNIFENPTQYNRMIKSLDNLWDNISPEDTDIDQYKRENFWIPIPYVNKNGDYVAFRSSLPLGDFGEFLDKPLLRTVSSTSPVIRAPFELAMNKQVFSGMPIREFKGQKGFQIPELGRYGEYALSQVGIDVPTRYLVADPLRAATQAARGEIDPLQAIYQAVSSSITSKGNIQKTQTRQAYEELDEIRKLMKFYKQEGVDIVKLSQIENQRTVDPVQDALNRLKALNKR